MRNRALSTSRNKDSSLSGFQPQPDVSNTSPTSSNIFSQSFCWSKHFHHFLPEWSKFNSLGRWKITHEAESNLRRKYSLSYEMFRWLKRIAQRLQRWLLLFGNLILDTKDVASWTHRPIHIRKRCRNDVMHKRNKLFIKFLIHFIHKQISTDFQIYLILLNMWNDENHENHESPQKCEEQFS